MKLSTPHINRNDITSITSVMRTGWISTSAKVVNDFEKRLSNFCQTKYSVALNSGTSAIHLGLRILGVDNNCEVIDPSLTFIATVNPILYLGAKPIIFDVDEYHNLKIEDVISFIENQSPVELIAIGIGHDVTRYYKKAVTLTDAEHLAGAMTEQLADLFDENV